MNAVNPPFAPLPSAREATDPRDQVFQALLHQSLSHPPEYGDGLSSHLPMALAALHGLGAEAAQMKRFATRYLRRSGLALQRAERLPPSALADPRALFGRFDGFAALRSHFDAALQRRGSRAVLPETVPLLMTGVAAAAFHGLIRTAHAVESGHDGELAAALAYWAARWLPLPPGDAPVAPPDRAPDWLAAVETSLRQVDAGWRSEAGMITRRMADAVRTATYRALAGGPRAHAEAGALLLLLARDATGRYLQTGNFTVLHMATAMRAALVLAPWCPPATHDGVMTAVWRGYLAARIASAAGPAPAVATGMPPAPAWRRIRAAACQSDDDHAIKLVHAMAWLARHAAASGGAPADAMWSSAAWRAVRPDKV